VCALGAAVASNLGDFMLQEDLSLLLPNRQSSAEDYVEHYQNDLGIGGQITNYGLYISATNHD
jgi:hypothetical protein